MIDNHCHPFDLDPGSFDLRRVTMDLSETPVASRAETGNEKVPPLWRALLRSRLAVRFGVAESDLIAARAAAVSDYRSYVSGLFAEAGITDMMMDPSFPLGSGERLVEFARLAGCRIYPVLRLESIIDPLIGRGAQFDEIKECFDEALTQAFEAGHRGLKSAIAYRTGLGIVADVPEQTARMSLLDKGPVRQQAKALRDFLMHRALQFAADHELPVQVHTGFGHSDLHLQHANPLYLEDLLRTPAGSRAQIILLHSGFPFEEEAAFLAATHPNVHVDLSLVGVFAPAALADSFVRVVGLAPPDRILVGTDAYRLPEVFWFAAMMLQEAWQEASLRFRRLGAASEWVEDCGEAIFEGNARRLYRLDGR